MIKKITDEGIIQIAKSALKKDVWPRFALLQYMSIKDMANIDLEQTGRPCNGCGDLCPALKCCSFCAQHCECNVNSIPKRLGLPEK